MTQLGKYLYCIVRCREERTFEDVAPVGDSGGPVYTVPQNGLAMVVSNSQAKEYESTRAYMVAHERVLEGVMRDLALLPVRFGTVADSASPTQDIQKLLERRFQEFDGLLTEMDGKVEVGLKALWRDEKAIFEELVAENADIRSVRNLLRRKPPEVVRFEGVRLGEMVKDALGRKRDAEAQSLLAPLRRIADRTVENQVVVDRMIVNAAFLVEKGREEEFDGAVARLDEQLGHRVVLRYVGPVPPYNFVNIVVNWQQL